MVVHIFVFYKLAEGGFKDTLIYSVANTLHILFWKYNTAIKINDEKSDVNHQLLVQLLVMEKTSQYLVCYRYLINTHVHAHAHTHACARACAHTHAHTHAHW